jgi:hypothetical protein
LLDGRPGPPIFATLPGIPTLLADSGHNLGDVLSLSLAWGAAVLSRRHTTIQIELADTDEACVPTREHVV